MPASHTTRVLLALLLVAPTLLLAGRSRARQLTEDYTDSYPKNPSVDVVNYVFEISVEHESDVIHAVTTIDARFLAGGSSEFRFDLSGASDVLDGKGMNLQAVELDGEKLDFRHQNDEVFVDLGREIAAGDRIKLTVRYTGVPAAGLVIGPTKYGDWSFFSDNWSSLARNWLPTVDHPYDKATNEFIINAPSRYQVVSNGRMVEETDIDAGRRRITHWKNSVPIATWLYAIGIAEFAVQYVDEFDGKSIETWVYRQDRDAGFHDFAEPSKQVLTYYSELIGPYVYERLANVQTTSVGGGMEAASTPFYSDRSVTGERDRRWVLVVIHEIAHQWFGNAVTEYDWNDVWLSEGFATYYTLLFRQHAYGHDDFVAGLEDARRRVIDYYTEDYDFRVVREYIEDLNRVSGPMMYQKGAWTLHMLRELVGVETYDAGVRSYYAEFMNGHARTADFQRHIEEASGRDLDGFFGQWLFQGGIPRLEFSWSDREGSFVIDVSQVQPAYRFDLPIEVEVTFADGSNETVVWHIAADQASSRAERTFDQPVVAVRVDPGTRLLADWTVERVE